MTNRPALDSFVLLRALRDSSEGRPLAIANICKEHGKDAVWSALDTLGLLGADGAIRENHRELTMSLLAELEPGPP